MAFLNRVGSLLKHNVSKHVTSSGSFASSPSLFQAMRSMCSYANTKVFVGGLAWGTDEPGLTQEFSKHGEVTEVRIITDRETGRSRGFGFVTFASADAASSAIKALDGQELQGRTIRVNLATERPRSGGYGGGGYGGGGGGYGGGGGGYGGGGGGYGGYNSGGGGGGYSGGGGGYGGYSGGGGNQGGNYSSGGDVGYSSGNQYSRGGGGGGGYPIGGSDGGFGAADSDNNPNFRSLLNDDTTGDVNHGPLGGDGGEIGAGNDDFGQDKDDVDYANTRN